MSLMKAFYEILYRRFRAPWDIGPRKDLVALIEEGRTHPAALSTWAAARRATSSFWRSNGFDVTGADYAVSVIELGRAGAGRRRQGHIHRGRSHEPAARRGVFSISW